MSSKGKPMVIEISSSSEDEETKINKSKAEKGRRRRYSDVKVKTEDKRMEEGEEDDDDDCYILPFDPLADDLNRKLSLCAAQSQLDDLSIVAERGQVACRDYPHSRHLCAEYPFSMTSHGSCCPKCYCYVCDDPAPCKFWKGPNGHCHASDQDEKWKEMRKLHGQKKGTEERAKEKRQSGARKSINAPGTEQSAEPQHLGGGAEHGEASTSGGQSGARRSLNVQEMERSVEEPKEGVGKSMKEPQRPRGGAEHRGAQARDRVEHPRERASMPRR